MDFNTGLPENVAYGSTYDAVLVVVDKLSKMCHYMPCRSDMTAEELAEVITREVIRLHGVPSAIISDRGSLFTSRLWVNLMYSFRIERRLSTAFQPQTDGQTERQKSVLEQYLRTYVNYQQDNWALLLALAEFAYNAAVHSSTSKAPFKIVYGEVPRSDILALDEVQKYSANRGSSAEGESLMERIRATGEEVTKSLVRAQAYQSRTYNKSHCDVEYKAGQKFWLRVKNITIERPSRKLDWQKYGPYRIIDRIRKVAYRLDLPASLQIHNVFHVSLLRDHKPRVGEESPEPLPLKLAIDPEVWEYEIEAIFASRIQLNPPNPPVLQYKIAWKGYTELMWEPTANLKHAR